MSRGRPTNEARREKAETLADLREIEIALCLVAIRARTAKGLSLDRGKLEVRALVEASRVIVSRRRFELDMAEDANVQELTDRVQELEAALAGGKSGQALRASAAVLLTGSDGPTAH